MIGDIFMQYVGRIVVRGIGGNMEVIVVLGRVEVEREGVVEGKDRHVGKYWWLMGLEERREGRS